MALTQQSLTPNGVAAMQQELNQLSPQDLQTQASLIQSDLGSWIADNFTLTSDQQTYLNGMSAQFLSYAGYITGFAVLNKLPVSLTVGSGGPKPFKLVTISDTIATTNTNTVFSVTGAVTYDVEYSDQG